MMNTEKNLHMFSTDVTIFRPNYIAHISNKVI